MRAWLAALIAMSAASAAADTATRAAPEPVPVPEPVPEPLANAGVVHGNLGPPGYVAFTFDDGPNEGTTSSILRTLAKHDVPAAFFIVGKSLRRHQRRALLASLHAAGHTVGNHTWSHRPMATLTAAERDEELDHGARVIADVTGEVPTIVRPPYGSASPKLRAALVARGLTVILWSLDPHDYEHTDEKSLRAAVLREIVGGNGGILVLHDSERLTARALPGILADLEAASCRRLRRGKRPYIPVSLHYFVENRPVPAEVAERTRRYEDALSVRCGTAKTTVDNHTDAH